MSQEKMTRKYTRNKVAPALCRYCTAKPVRGSDQRQCPSCGGYRATTRRAGRVARMKSESAA